MTTNFWSLSVMVFSCTLAADFAWTKYMMYAAVKRRLPASFWSAAIIGFGGLNVISYEHNALLIIPAMLGAFAGTWIAIGKS